ncbi:MAG: SMP-30/gluconolactonase/LRE family protein [Solirubrobacterales bacterium]|nr:SMP-30/gluconolactonase/LRE family protein [Solirubrobacterales bacterium]MCB0870285.1 SMP-30/gluconolactonase/LRE family protein [Solirubrobacterales bacterium]
MRKRLVSITAVFALASLAFVPNAMAIPDCEGPVSQKTLYTGQGVLEAVISGGGGKLFVSGTRTGFDDPASLIRIDRPGAAPEVISSAPAGPGGLTWAGRQLIWGNGNTLAGGQSGDANPQARLLKVNPKNGKYTTWATGLGMANGVTKDRTGNVFASNDFGLKLDRITPGGVTTHGWADVESGNGMVVGKNGKYLFVNQTFRNPGSIARVELANPSNVTTWFSAAGLDNQVPAFDGLTRDGENNLYAAAWAPGEIWKITPDRQVCKLASGIPQISNVAFGGGKSGFNRSTLYAVGFGGQIVQVKGALNATVPAT